MKNVEQTQYLARDSIMKLLSDAEIASVSTAETTARLADGDEYIDLQHIDRGVLKASGKTTPMRQILPRSAVQPATWTQIAKRLPASNGDSFGKRDAAREGIAPPVVRPSAGKKPPIAKA
jgi:hypothetical protein